MKVYAMGGSSPLSANGPASAAVAAAFSGGSASQTLRENRQYSAYACVPPGQYTLARFDSIGSGAWAPYSAAVAVPEAVLLSPPAASSNGNGTGVLPLGVAPVYELCDSFAVPALPRGAAPDRPSPAPTGGSR